MHAWLSTIGAHPTIALALVFGVACAESLAIVGTLVPAGIVMFAAGALIGAGVLDAWVTLLIAALGAVAGDGLSYELGRRYRAEVKTWWTQKGHAAAYERGEQFVQKYGAKSIVLARFFAPVRAVVPLVVGCARMPRRIFYPVNVASALAWSPAHIAPGIVFGASAALAEAVSARLAIMLLILALLLWVVVRVSRLAIVHGVPLLKQSLRHAVPGLKRRFPRLCATVDPDTPEFGTLSVLVLLFIASVWLFGGVLQDVVANDPLMQADTAIFTFLQSLRAAPVDALMTSLTALNSLWVGLTVAAAVLVWLAVQRTWRTAAWWLVVVGIAAVLTPVVGARSGAALPINWQPGSTHAPLPDGGAAFSILVYGALGWLMVCRQTGWWRSAVAVTVALWLALTGFAQLYAGKAWLSGLLGGWSLGLAWFSVLAGTYVYREVHEDVRPRGAALVVIAVLAVSGLWVIPRQVEMDRSQHGARQSIVSLTRQQWVNAGWQQLPARRTEISGDEEEYLPLQWTADLPVIERDLQHAGWQPASSWSVRTALGWLLPQTAADRLPVLPKYSQGESSSLAFIRVDPQQPATRLVVRLWRSHYVVKNPRGETPLWYGALYRETLYRPAHFFTLATTHDVSGAAAIAQLLAIHGRTVSRPETTDTTGTAASDVLLATSDGNAAPGRPLP